MKTSSVADSKIWSSLASGKVRPEIIATRVVEKPGLLTELFPGLDQPQARVKFGCAKILLLVSETRPKLLLPYWEELNPLLKAENKILQWSAILTLGNLGSVASPDQVKGLLPRLCRFLPGPRMITAANTMRSLEKIAKAHPELTDSIVQRVFEVERGNYQTPECRNVAIGHALQFLKTALPNLTDKGSAIAFATRQIKNSRPSTRNKAQALLKQLKRQQE